MLRNALVLCRKEFYWFIKVVQKGRAGGGREDRLGCLESKQCFALNKVTLVLAKFVFIWKERWRTTSYLQTLYSVSRSGRAIIHTENRRTGKESGEAC